MPLLFRGAITNDFKNTTIVEKRIYKPIEVCQEICQHPSPRNGRADPEGPAFTVRDCTVTTLHCISANYTLCRRLSCADRKTIRILRHSFFKGFDCDKVKHDDYCLPGYSDLNHQNSMVTSVSYKTYSPEVLPFTGDKSIWKAFDEL